MSGDPSFSSTTSPNPERLIAGEFPRVTKDVTIVSGENLTEGDLLGKIVADTVPSTGTADGGNTGNGTVSSVSAGGADIQEGTYTVRCYEAATDGGFFEVIAPDGTLVGIAVVGTAFTSSHLDLTINDGSTDFAVGDQFTIAVSGSDKWKKSAAAATDGSATPRAILTKDVDASGGDKEGPVYMTGEFNEAQVGFGSGHTADSVREELAARGIHLTTTTDA